MDRYALYRRLPYPLKVLAASARGAYLQRWRYGADLEAQVAAISEREAWDAEAWQSWREQRLATILDAASRAPAYGRQWQDRAGNSARLADWPRLDKSSLRAAPEDFLVAGSNRRQLYPEHTSGSTGTPLHLWWGRDTVRAWYALVETRLRRWHGVSKDDRWAILGGQLVTDVRRRRPPFWVWNAGMRQLYLSAYHLAPAFAADQLEALRRHRVRYLLGYPSALHSLASAMLDQGLDAGDLGLRVAITNAEPLYPHQRRAIGEAFACPVRETYGMAELVAAASECEAGRLHLWPEVGVVEVAEDGELIATGLLNRHQPLIRYRVGDRLVLDHDATPCGCGRTLPTVARIDGRTDDVLVTPDGRRVGRLDPVFKADLPLVEAQIVQRRLDLVVLRLVPAAGFDDATQADLRHRLGERLGDGVKIEIECVDRLERGPGGKLRAVIGMGS